MLKIFMSSLLLLSVSSLAAEITIHQNNDTQHIRVSDHARLSDVYQKSKFQNNINWPAVFLTNSILTETAHTKKNEVIRKLNALITTDSDHKNELNGLIHYLKNLPVAGRIRTTLDPDWINVRPLLNRPVVGHYDLYTTAYPGTISVIGLTEQKKVLPIDLAQVHDYLKLIASSELAAPGYAYLIEPDGSVSKVGVAIWNRKEDRVVMPGSVIFVGLNPSALPDSYNALNEDIIAVLANRIPE